jgi:hypothetical protein
MNKFVVVGILMSVDYRKVKELDISNVTIQARPTGPKDQPFNLNGSFFGRHAQDIRGVGIGSVIVASGKLKTDKLGNLVASFDDFTKVGAPIASENERLADVGDEF